MIVFPAHFVCQCAGTIEFIHKIFVMNLNFYFNQTILIKLVFLQNTANNEVLCV